MTLVEGSLFFLCVVCFVSALSLIAYIRWNMEQDRKAGVEGLDSFDALPWRGWTPSIGWPRCWGECRDFHRPDWWREYLYRTCWDGCADLHRADWWRAYVDQADVETPRVHAESRSWWRPGREGGPARRLRLNRSKPAESAMTAFAVAGAFDPAQDLQALFRPGGQYGSSITLR